MYIYIYIYIYTHLYTYIYMCVYVYVYIYIYIYIDVDIYKCLWVYMNVYIYMHPVQFCTLNLWNSDKTKSRGGRLWQGKRRLLKNMRAARKFYTEKMHWLFFVVKWVDLTFLRRRVYSDRVACMCDVRDGVCVYACVLSIFCANGQMYECEHISTQETRMCVCTCTRTHRFI